MAAVTPPPYVQRSAPPAPPATPDHESASLMLEDTRPTGQGGMKIERIEIRPAANGGFIAAVSRSLKPTGAKDNGETYDSKDYAFTDFASMDAFLAKQLRATTAPPAPMQPAPPPMMEEPETAPVEEPE